MFPTIVMFYIVLTKLSSIFSASIVIEMERGECGTLADQIAQQHGYRYVRQILQGFCEIEEDPLSENHERHRRAIEQGIDLAQILVQHEHIHWAESQIPKIRRKRELILNDSEWNNMWYLMRNTKNPSLPDLNVTGAWEMGYTGRGHIVTFLDDGLEFDHPDLLENYDKEASTDINGNDDDPTPRYEPTNENKHGTRCAGEVAAKANNQICGVGIAYHARVGGIRMLDGDVTDSVEARSISHRPDHVEIYSASWGPDDNGLVVDGPGILAKKAFENGILHGRSGKGSIFVWASGNGGRSSDSCACDGYINSIYTIAVSSVTESGNKPWYLEECSGTLTSAYSSGQGGADHDIITTDLHHGCTNHHTGTSAAAPLAAAIYALVLEANTNLTWRDVMHITVLGSRPHAIPSNTELVRNAAGFNVSSKYGFGLMDAGLMTWYASGWTNVPNMSSCRSPVMNTKTKIKENSNEMFGIDLIECRNSSDAKTEVNYMEQVQVFVTLRTQRRGEIEIYLYSPSNTTTKLLPSRANDKSDQGFQDWPFLTVQLWGETPHGQWKLQIVNTAGGTAELVSYRLVVHGTRDYPISARSLSNISRSTCHIECKPDEPCGNTDTNCTSCRHNKQPLANGQFRCVGICPEGTYPGEVDKICYSCHTKCGSCRNASEISCISCKSSFFLVPDAMQCVESCPDTYYTDRKLRKCIRCAPGCSSCQNRPDVCSSCPADYAVKDTICVKAAKDCQSTEYYDFTLNLCRWCDSQCLTCSGSQSHQCISCDKTGKYPYRQSTACVSSCSPGFYLVSNLSQCLPCFDTCLNCTSSSETACLACKLGYVYLSDSHRCEKYTGRPYFRDTNTGESRSCHPSCTQCKGPNPTDCLACNSLTEVLLEDGHCVNECPTGFYVNTTNIEAFETNICSPCPTGCEKCHDQYQCVQCIESQGYRSHGFDCVPTCQSGSYLLDTHCELCQTPCLTCTNRTSCLTCQDKLFLLDSQCLENCSVGYYANKKQCLQCNLLCSACFGPSENDCVTCADGFIFDEKEKKCSSLCPNGNFFHKDDQTCHLCSDDCLECVHSGSYCRQCSYPMSLNTSTHKCLLCCTTNITTDDCCQCPSVWDGFCLHPLVTSIAQSSSWWSKSPLDQIRERFVDLDRSNQTIIIVLLILSICISLIGLLAFSLYHFRSYRLRFRSSSKHENVDYIMLENVDDNDEIKTELSSR